MKKLKPTKKNWPSKLLARKRLLSIITLKQRTKQDTDLYKYVISIEISSLENPNIEQKMATL